MASWPVSILVTASVLNSKSPSLDAFVFYILCRHTPNGRRGTMPAGYINTVNVNQEFSRRRRGAAAAAAGGGSGGDGGLLGRLTQQFGGKG